MWIGDVDAAVDQVPRCSDLQTPVYQNFELVLHSLWDVEPVQFIMQQLCQTVHGRTYQYRWRDGRSLVACQFYMFPIFIIIVIIVIYYIKSSYFRQVNEVNGEDTVFVRCVSVCLCLCAADR